MIHLHAPDREENASIPIMLIYQEEMEKPCQPFIEKIVPWYGYVILG